MVQPVFGVCVRVCAWLLGGCECAEVVNAPVRPLGIESSGTTAREVIIESAAFVYFMSNSCEEPKAKRQRALTSTVTKCSHSVSVRIAWTLMFRTNCSIIQEKFHEITEISAYDSSLT